jgi:sarcosine oxidase, subunit alpha
MGRRFLAVSRPVTIRLDGATLVANEGEPLAAALVGAGIDTIARSPKFHRPRGATCMRGGCDGCVVRVDGVPNVLGCLEPCREGMVVETQNRMGPREFDLLRANDWFFPSGMNHHEVFIGVPGAEPFLRVFARRISGLGHLPDDPVPVVTGARRAVTVLVLGGGAAGLAAAVAFAEAGARVELVDEHTGIQAVRERHAGEELVRVDALLARVDALAAEGRVVVRARTKAVGIFSGLVLLEGAAGAEVLDAALTVLATGAHDGPAIFEGNDLPGVYSLRAARRLVAAGVAPGKRVVVVVDPSVGERVKHVAEALAAELTAANTPCVVHTGRVTKAHGSSHVKKVTLVDAQATEHVLPADALVVEGPRSPSFELAQQAGASVVRTKSGFAVPPDALGGRFAVVGEITGASPDVAAFESRARELAASWREASR